MPQLRRYALLVALLVASSSLAMGQWTRIPYGSAQFWNEVFFVDNDHGWVTGQTPLMLRTVDGGLTWIPTSLPGATFSANRDICFLDPSFGIVSGEDGVWRTNDGGATWMSIAPPAQLGQTLGAVWFIDRNQGVCAFGNCDNTLVTFCRTGDGGASWRVVQYNYPNVDVSVGGITHQNGIWYAAGGLGKFWTSTDNGNSWSLTNTGSSGWQEDLISRFGFLYIASADGGSCTAAFGGRVLRSGDGGASWISTIFPTLMWGVTMVSPTVGWSCGDKGLAYKTTDGGLSWTDSSCGLDHTALIDDIWFSDADHGWAVGNGIYRYTPLQSVSVSRGPFTICRGDSIALNATGGAGYTWTPAKGLSCSDCAVPTAFPDTTTLYRVVINRFGECSVTDSVLVQVNRVGATVEPGTTLCAGDSVRLMVSGGVSVQWSPSDGLDCDTCRTPMARPESTTTYVATVTGSNGCRERLSTMVRIVPAPKLNSSSLTLCAGDAAQLSASGGGIYEWTPSTGLSCADCPDPIARPDSTTTYRVRIRTAEGCESIDSVTVVVVASKLQLVGLDTAIIIDTTELLSTRCREFVVRNLSESDKVIDRPWLVRNTEFSIPPSELPLVVPAGGEARLTICYRPTAEFVQRDTLMIPDDCPQAIPVQGRGIRFPIRDGQVCDSVGIRIGEILGGPFLRIGGGYGETARQGMATTTWFVGRDDQVRIELVDLRGKTVRELFNGREARGEHQLDWSTDALPSGLYFYRITAGSMQAQARVVIAR